ncbi:MAG: serine protease [Chloroflexi bacterium]|nr:serine protease [Chloroflexota bacterium]
MASVWYPAAMAEGLFVPDTLAVPFNEERVLRSLVRTRTHLYFVVTVFATEAEAAAFRGALNLPTGYQKVNLPEGVVLWYVVFDRDGLEAIQRDPAQRLRPAFYEAVQATVDVTALPMQRVVPAEGQGTAFCITPDGRLLTNYHIAREEIEPAGRTNGAYHPQRCRYLSCDTLEVDGGRVAGYLPLPDVDLLANLAADDWKAGWDAVLLQAATPLPSHLEPASEPPRVGDPVWAYGFPMRSQRPPERLAGLRYRDANHTLRVTHGCITVWLDDHRFVADLDGLAGSSGGPVVDRRGHVVGLVQDIFPPTEVHRRLCHFDGGMVCVAVQPVLERLQQLGDA